MSVTHLSRPGRRGLLWRCRCCASRRRCVGLVRSAAVAVGLMLAGAVLLVGCADRSGDSEAGDASPLTLGAGHSASDAARVVEWEAVPEDLRALSHYEIYRGGATEHHGVSRLLREVGAVELLERYIINIPPSAPFLVGFELSKATSAAHSFYAADGASGAVRRDFERRVLIDANGTFGNGLPPAGDPGVLHDAFFEVLEWCGRESPWPDVELFVMGDGYAGDYVPQLVERDFGLSYFEYKELLHKCGRYAATYPTLDPAVRDELLAPQRAHYAREVLEGLDELPVAEVPAMYQAEIDELRQNGW